MELLRDGVEMTTSTEDLDEPMTCYPTNHKMKSAKSAPAGIAIMIAGIARIPVINIALAVFEFFSLFAR